MSVNSPVLDDAVQKAFEDGRRNYVANGVDSEKAALFILKLKRQLKQSGVKEEDYSKHYQVPEEDKARMLGAAVGLLYATHSKDPNIKYVGSPRGLEIRAFDMALIILEAIGGLGHPEVQKALSESRLVKEFDPLQQRLGQMEIEKPSDRYLKPTERDLSFFGNRYFSHFYNKEPVQRK